MINVTNILIHFYLFFIHESNAKTIILFSEKRNIDWARDFEVFGYFVGAFCIICYLIYGVRSCIFEENSKKIVLAWTWPCLIPLFPIVLLTIYCFKYFFKHECIENNENNAVIEYEEIPIPATP